MSELIHMVFIAYYDKKGDGKDVKQLQDHRDQRYTQNDYYMHSSNSQERHTVTCILSIGDTRQLNFQLSNDNNTGNKEGSIAIDEDLATHPFELKHGSLFVIHPKDEETVLCEFF